jgi:hypothetical protein
MFYMLDIIFAATRKEHIGRNILKGFVFTIAFCLSLYVAWPTLWEHPVTSFIECFKSMSHFRWRGQVLFFGKQYWQDQLPWTYIPGWIMITVPMLWAFAGVGGIILVIASFLRTPLQYLKNTTERNYVLYAFCTAVPVTMVIVLQSVVYDDWRHLYFTYPSFVLLALLIIHKLSVTKVKRAVILLAIVQLAHTAYFMVRYHPFQQVYFNKLVSHEDESLRKNFDLDYWGAGYKQGLDFLMASDTGYTLKICRANDLVINNIAILNAPFREKFKIDDENDCDYYMTNFRDHPEDYGYPIVLYNIKVLNSTILRVYRVR